MPYYHIGEVIKKLRIERGMTQEKLAEEVSISTANLSRLENGKHMPHKKIIDQILKKLEVDPQEIYDRFLFKEESEIDKKCDDLLSLVDNDKNIEAKAIINELSSLPEFKKGTKAQLLLYCKASIMMNLKQDSKEIREIIIEALNITILEFSEESVLKIFPTELETRLLNTLSITYFNENNLGKAIDILEELKKIIDTSRVDENEKSKLYALILFNLSKYYRQANRYLEAIEICDFAKNICLKMNDMVQLPEFMFNKACCLYELGYRDECKILLYLAFYNYMMIKDDISREIVKNYAKEKFGIDFYEGVKLRGDMYVK